EDATRISGLESIVPSTETQAFLEAVGGRSEFTSTEGGVKVGGSAETLYLLLPNGDRDRIGQREYRQENEFAKGLAGYTVANARPVFDELRQVKSPYEIKLLQH